ncbi:MAG: polysaccharide biosynthesis protein [Bdellovibrionales bacterium]|nr:polysaccharide biosynthesis protein [Bdellovibrionales bacterium]
MAKKLIIVGAGEAGRMVATEILRTPALTGKYEITGFIDDDTQKTEVLGLPVLGPIREAEAVLKKHRADEVLIAIPSASRDLINSIVDVVFNSTARVKIVPGFHEIIEGNVTAREIRGIEPADLLGREEVGFDIEKIRSFYENKKLFVTGAGGSIGSEIFAQLLELPIREAIALGHGENSIYSLISRFGGDRRFRYVIGDMRDAAKMERELMRFRPDVLFHAAAHKHVPLMEDYPDEAVRNNVFGTLATARAAIAAGVKDFIFVSTDKAVNPTSAMGASKRLAERIVLSLNGHQKTTHFSLTRFGNVLGSRGSVVPVFQEQIERGGPLTVTHPEMTRYFMSIREAARLVIKSGSAARAGGQIFVLDMGQPFKIVDLARRMIRMSGLSESDIPIVFSGLRPGEKMYEEVLTADEHLSKTDFSKLFVSTQREIPFSPAEVQSILAEFEEVIETGDGAEVKCRLQKYVPEYRPQGLRN